MSKPYYVEVDRAQEPATWPSTPPVESMEDWIERYGQPSPGLRPILERHFKGSGSGS